MEVKIRPAKPSDYKEVEGLMKQIQRHHIELRPDIFVEVDPVMTKKTFFNHLIDKNDYVADINGKVVGYVSIAFVHKEYSTIKSTNLICVNTIVVDKSYRRMGIGRKMIEYLQELKKQIHFDKIELKVWSNNESAIAFYKSIGMVPETLTMVL